MEGLFTRARSWCDAMRAPTWGVFVDLHWGAFLIDDGDEDRGRELVARAERCGRELGMTRSLRELERLERVRPATGSSGR